MSILKQVLNHIKLKKVLILSLFVCWSALLALENLAEVTGVIQLLRDLWVQDGDRSI